MCMYGRYGMVRRGIIFVCKQTSIWVVGEGARVGGSFI